MSTDEVHDDIHFDLWVEVAKRLDRKGLLSLRATCRSLKDVVRFDGRVKLKFNYTASVKNMKHFCRVFGEVDHISYEKVSSEFILYPTISTKVAFIQCGGLVDLTLLPKTVENLQLLDTSFREIDTRMFPKLKTFYVHFPRGRQRCQIKVNISSEIEDLNLMGYGGDKEGLFIVTTKLGSARHLLNNLVHTYISGPNFSKVVHHPAPLNERRPFA